MKKLFGQDETWTEEGININRDIVNIIEKAIRYWAKREYSIRELCLIAHGCITEIECKLVMEKRTKKAITK